MMMRHYECHPRAMQIMLKATLTTRLQRGHRGHCTGTYGRCDTGVDGE